MKRNLDIANKFCQSRAKNRSYFGRFTHFFEIKFYWHLPFVSMSYLKAMTQSFTEENYTKSLEKLQTEIKLFDKFQKRTSRQFVSVRRVKIYCYFLVENFNCPPLCYLFADEKLSWNSLKKNHEKKKSLKPQFLLLWGTITCYWRRTVNGGGEGAVAFCADFLPPCGSTMLPVKNGQLKFHNCHNEKSIVNCSPCLTYWSGTGTDIYIYHLLQNSKRQGCGKLEQGAQMSCKCGQ